MEEIASVFGLNWKLLIIQAVNFGVLLLVLRYFLYKPVLKMLDERREKVEKGVKDAEAAGVRIQEIEGERDGVLTDASNKAGEILETSKTRAQEQASQIATDANARAETILESANLRSEELKEQALRESKAEIGKAAILAAEVILRDKK